MVYLSNAGALASKPLESLTRWEPTCRGREKQQGDESKCPFFPFGGGKKWGSTKNAGIEFWMNLDREEWPQDISRKAAQTEKHKTLSSTDNPVFPTRSSKVWSDFPPLSGPRLNDSTPSATFSQCPPEEEANPASFQPFICYRKPRLPDCFTHWCLGYVLPNFFCISDEFVMSQKQKFFHGFVSNLLLFHFVLVVNN